MSTAHESSEALILDAAENIEDGRTLATVVFIQMLFNWTHCEKPCNYLHIPDEKWTKTRKVWKKQKL